MIASTGLNKRQLGDWMARARKEMKAKSSKPLTIDNRLALTSSLCKSTNDDKLILESSNQTTEPVQESHSNTLLTASKSNAEGTLSDRPETSNQPTSLGQDRRKEPNPSATLQSKKLTPEDKLYLSNWLSGHSAKPYPTREEKDAMMSLLDILDERKLEGWFCRARKKLKKHHNSFDRDPKSQASKSTNSLRPLIPGAGGVVDSIVQSSSMPEVMLWSDNDDVDKGDLGDKADKVDHDLNQTVKMGDGF